MRLLFILASAVEGGWAGDAPLEQPLALCVINPQSVSSDLRQEWEQELRRIGHSSGLRLETAGCASAEAIRIRFLKRNSDEPLALGAALTSGGRIEPMLEVYLEPVSTMIGTRLAGPLGKALARVTAHELRHYLAQERGHGAHADSPVYSAGVLLAAKPAYFRLR